MFDWFVKWVGVNKEKTKEEEEEEEEKTKKNKKNVTCVVMKQKQLKAKAAQLLEATNRKAIWIDDNCHFHLRQILDILQVVAQSSKLT